MDCWFNLPNGETAQELPVTIPVKGQVVFSAAIAREIDEWKDLLVESMRKQKWTTHGRLRDMLASCLSGYEGIASEALHGAQSVRDDMLVMLRAIVIVAESIVGDHLNHGQKNERIRGMIGVLERSIESLRQEQFRFHGPLWRRGRDLFQWDEPERRLRERISELERQLADKLNATEPQFNDRPSESEVGF